MYKNSIGFHFYPPPSSFLPTPITSWVLVSTRPALCHYQIIILTTETQISVLPPCWNLTNSLYSPVYLHSSSQCPVFVGTLPAQQTHGDVRTELDFDRFHDGLANMAHVGTGLCRLEGRMTAVRSWYLQFVFVARKVSIRARFGRRHGAGRQRVHLRLLRHLQHMHVVRCGVDWRVAWGWARR